MLCLTRHGGWQRSQSDSYYRGMKGTILKLCTKYQERRLATDGRGAGYSLIAQRDDEKLQSGAEKNHHEVLGGITWMEAPVQPRQWVGEQTKAPHWYKVFHDLGLQRWYRSITHHVGRSSVSSWELVGLIYVHLIYCYMMVRRVNITYCCFPRNAEHSPKFSYVFLYKFRLRLLGFVSALVWWHYIPNCHSSRSDFYHVLSSFT